MRTRLGDILREIRFNNDERTYDMAKKINVSSAFLSAIEHGKKQAPKDFYNKIVSIYRVSKSMETQLLSEIDRSKSGVFIKTDKPDVRETAAVFARKADKLSEKELNEINIILRRGG